MKSKRETLMPYLYYSLTSTDTSIVLLSRAITRFPNKISENKHATKRILKFKVENKYEMQRYHGHLPKSLEQVRGMSYTTCLIFCRWTWWCRDYDSETNT